ncbi:hypothetical protein ALC53_11228 [Atta colombica]|uniref:Uncharacterized protein n=1 Tax=Atta colombica TaxID=520822 RepID=A0A195B276_9HYME|nr:hypothetical protein ALC53_11228 [Atta colombica]
MRGGGGSDEGSLGEGEEEGKKPSFTIDFSRQVRKTAYIAHCHFDLRLRYWTLWTQISVKVIPYDAVARRSQRVIDSIYFGMYRRTHLQRFLLSFGFLAFQFQYRYAYSRGKNSKM